MYPTFLADMKETNKTDVWFEILFHFFNILFFFDLLLHSVIFPLDSMGNAFLVFYPIWMQFSQTVPLSSYAKFQLTRRKGPNLHLVSQEQ